MNQYITGSLIKELREKKGLTQAELSKKLCVSDKAVSKWETGKGYPDITLLEPIAKVFNISLAELLSGNTIENTNTSSNVAKSLFYVCPICGNVVFSMGNLSLSCHGVTLFSEIPEPCDNKHDITIEQVEDEYYIKINHEMTKSHYISFIAGIYDDKTEMIKLYPEASAECRLPMRLLKRIVFYCNRDGLYYKDIK